MEAQKPTNKKIEQKGKSQGLETKESSMKDEDLEPITVHLSDERILTPGTRARAAELRTLPLPFPAPAPALALALLQALALALPCLACPLAFVRSGTRRTPFHSSHCG